MCGARSYAAIAQWGHDQDIALMHQLGFTRKPPKLDGIRKVLIALNSDAFENALSRWAESLRARRDARGGRQSHPQGRRSRDHDRLAQCGDWLPPDHRRDEYRRDHTAERFPGREALHQTGHLQK
jgi:hypothetical protein